MIKLNFLLLNSLSEAHQVLFYWIDWIFVLKHISPTDILFIISIFF